MQGLLTNFDKILFFNIKYYIDLIRVALNKLLKI